MEIYKEDQYNQEVSKYKLLSTNAGVGSIVATKAGNFIMPMSTTRWGIIKAVKQQLEHYPEVTDPVKIADRAGVNVIDDARFIEFLQYDQELTNMKMLLDIPFLSLNFFNQPNYKEHPLYKKYDLKNPGTLDAAHFQIPALHFPRWFYSRRYSTFKPLEEWITDWQVKGCNGGKLTYFAPPRDPDHKIGWRRGGKNGEIDLYKPLVQIPLLMICKNGHLSDIPWYELFCADVEGNRHLLDRPEGFDLSGYLCRDCKEGGKHELQWIENRNQSESWGTLRCRRCHETVSLEGIMNIRPTCKGETPWNGIGRTSRNRCTDYFNDPSTMRVALATSNSVYYADTFSSLYIPPSYRTSDTTDSIRPDFRESYRFEEYRVFTCHQRSADEENKLAFKDINLPATLVSYFTKIQQVNNLAITSTQLGFSRVSMPTPKRIDGRIVMEKLQPIHEHDKPDVNVLPAIQKYGEGLFFQFKNESVDRWQRLFENRFKTRYQRRTGRMEEALKVELELYGAPGFFLLHTFAHLLLKELEFSCGYPTASLQERLYYSDRMCGVLIYTADGGEGSMGGLVWQGQPRLIEKIIFDALDRAKVCSGDPICWVNEEKLNFSSCFSCCLVSETACEKRNLGLDRRALIDPEFGYFRSLEQP